MPNSKNENQQIQHKKNQNKAEKIRKESIQLKSLIRENDEFYMKKNREFLPRIFADKKFQYISKFLTQHENIMSKPNELVYQSKM